jgi:hypothetical protein
VRTRYARSVLTVTTAVVAAVLGVTAVLAATTWTVRPGGPVSLKSGRFMVKDTRNRLSLTCLSSALGGTLKSGSGLSGGSGRPRIPGRRERPRCLHRGA